MIREERWADYAMNHNSLPNFEGNAEFTAVVSPDIICYMYRFFYFDFPFVSHAIFSYRFVLAGCKIGHCLLCRLETINYISYLSIIFSFNELPIKYFVYLSKIPLSFKSRRSCQCFDVEIYKQILNNSTYLLQ